MSVADTARLIETELVAHTGGAVRYATPTQRVAPLPKRARYGIWVWTVLLGASTAYELWAFLDGKGGQPTLSQLVKGFVHAGGVAAAAGVTLVLFGGAAVLFLHWVLGAF